MTTKNLYVYNRPDGGVTVSPNAPEVNTPFTTSYRLIAEDGKILQEIADPTVQTICVDTDYPEQWTEIDAPIKGPDEKSVD